VTQRVDRALESGLVRRLPPQRGTRTVLVGLTTAGHREVARAVGSLLAHEQGLVGALEPDDQAELSRLLALLLARLSSGARLSGSRPASGRVTRGAGIADWHWAERVPPLRFRPQPAGQG
jgi:hypothetical protein